jgi:hypothetical protein
VDIMTWTPGTNPASLAVMRVLAALLLGGCFAVGSSGGTRPAVMPMLSELPAEKGNRDAVLESASKAAGPEHRKGSTKKERQAETAAATAAAILGSMFSKTTSVTIGTSSQFDENQIIAPQAVPLVIPSSDDSADATKSDAAGKPDALPPPDVTPPNTDLIPWIKLKR